MKFRTIVIVLCLSSFFLNKETKAGILNASFENYHLDYMPMGTTAIMPDDWDWRNVGALNGYVQHNTPGILYPWSSEGNYALYIYARSKHMHSVGEYVEFYQNIDMTGMTKLLFDVNRRVRDGAVTNSYLAIDSQKVWIQNLSGIFIDESIDINNYSGVHEFSLGVEVLRDFGMNADGWTYFDNLRLIPEPCTLLLLGLGGLALQRKIRR